MVMSVMPISFSTWVTGTRPEPFRGLYTSLRPAVLHRPGRTWRASMAWYRAFLQSSPTKRIRPCSTPSAKEMYFAPVSTSVFWISS